MSIDNDGGLTGTWIRLGGYYNPQYTAQNTNLFTITEFRVEFIAALTVKINVSLSVTSALTAGNTYQVLTLSGRMIDNHRFRGGRQALSAFSNSKSQPIGAMTDNGGSNIWIGVPANISSGDTIVISGVAELT